MWIRGSSPTVREGSVGRVKPSLTVGLLPRCIPKDSLAEESEMRRLVATLALLLVTTSVVCGQSKNRNRTWLNGTWEGTGYQIDNNETWTMRLTVKGNRYRIEYPSLNCAGTWGPIKFGSSRVRFRETITRGVEVCTNKGRVVIVRLSRRQLAYRYVNQGETDVTASAILNRKK